MAFGFPTPPGDFLPIIKYDARAGSLLLVDKGADGTNVQTNITAPGLKFAIDFQALEVGYIHFGASGPQKRLVPYGAPLPPMPEDKGADGKPLFRPGISLRLAGQALGGVREMSSTTQILMGALDELFTEVLPTAEFASGKIPLVSVGNPVPVTRGSGMQRSTNYRPSLTVVGWVSRTPEMGPALIKLPIVANRPASPPAVQSLSNGHAVAPAPTPAVAGRVQLAEPTEMPF